MTKCVLSMTLLAVASFAQIGLSGEPITDLKDFEAELGTWTRGRNCHAAIFRRQFDTVLPVPAGCGVQQSRPIRRLNRGIVF